MENHYNKLNAKYKSKSFNPNKGKTHNIDIPFRMVIVGSSGSGKSNCLMNLLKVAFNGTFNHIYLCCKDANEPLYRQMIDKLRDNITVFENGEVPSLSELPKNEEQLIIFDDLVGDKNATKEIIEYFKMARKKGISCCYLSQSYFKVDKFIRQNTNYIIIKKVSSKKDLKLILSEYSFNCDIKEIEAMYHYATKKYEDVMLLDILHSHIYHNFNQRIL
jgi:ABC-type dipeptide/oligopeptide/nickel transport system ATPase component